MPDLRRARSLRKPHLALDQGERPQILAVELDQVEGVEEHQLIVGFAVQAVEHGEAVVSADHAFAIDVKRASAQFAGGCTISGNRYVQSAPRRV